MKTYLKLLLCGLCFSLISCADNQVKEVAKIADLSDLDWSKINSANIYFGHKSVGRNLMDGLEMVRQKYPQFTLPVADEGAENTGEPGLYHSMIGENWNPQSKFDAFFNEQSKFVQEDSVVAMKLCFLDIGRGTDVSALFDDYQGRVEGFVAANPNKTLLHFTTPLTHDAKDLKSRVKRMLGRPVRGYEENLLRHQYNQLILNQYGGAVFDIARVESTVSGGRIKGELQGEEYYAMDDQYTNDGGHLNDYGKEYVATEFIKFLADTL